MGSGGIRHKTADVIIEFSGSKSRSKQNNDSKVEQDTRTIEHDTNSNLLLDQSLKAQSIKSQSYVITPDKVLKLLHNYYEEILLKHLSVQKQQKQLLDVAITVSEKLSCIQHSLTNMKITTSHQKKTR